MNLFRTSDAELVRRARGKDSAAFEELIRRYLRAAHAIVRSAGVDVDDLDDVVQDACIAAFEKLDSLRDPASVGGWLLKIAKNEAIESLRRKNPPGCGTYGVTEGLPDRRLERKEFEDYLRGRILALPDGICETIFLYYYEGGSTRQVARVLGITSNLVKQRLKRGRDLLREQLWRRMEADFRDMLPCTRSWDKSARKLALVVMVSLSPTAIRPQSLPPAPASAANAALVLAGAFLVVGAIGVGMVMMAGPGQKGPAGGADLAARLDRVPAEGNPAGSVRRDSVPEAEARTRLRGTVYLGDRNSPAAGAQVALIRDGEAPREPATTGLDGRFTIRLPRPGSYHLLASKDGWATDDADRQTLEIRDGEPVPEIERILVPGVVIAGEVRDYASKGPISGARITYRDIELQYATSDAEGRFRLEGVLPGGIEVTVTAPGYEVKKIRTQAAAGEKPSSWRFELFPGAILQGRVLTARGQPAVGALVEAFAWVGIRLECRTDGDGRYRLEGIPFNAGEICLLASLGGLFVSSMTVLDEFSAGESQTVRDLRLTEGRVLAGRVLGPDGVPLAGVDFYAGDSGKPLAASNAKGEFRIEGVSPGKGLTAWKKGYARHWIEPGQFVAAEDLLLEPGHTLRRRVTDHSGNPLSRAMVGCDVHEGGLHLFVFTSPDGSFEFQDLPNSIHALAVGKYGFLNHHEQSVQVADRDEPVVLAESGVIRGVVVDNTTGEPIRSFSVRSNGPGHDVDSILTFGSADGRFSLDNNLHPGNSYGLTLSAEGYVATTVSAAAWSRREEREPQPVELGPGKSLEGQVLSAATGKGLERVQAIYRFSSPDGLPVQRVTDEKGQLSMTGLPPDTPGTLELQKAGYARTVFSNVLPGDAGPFPLQVEAVVSGTVLDSSERPVSGARIEVFTAEERSSPATVDGEGRYRVSRLPAGPARVSVYLHGVFIATREETLVAGQKTTVEFRLPDGSIRGTVTERGLPAADAVVRIVGSLRQEKVNADGEFAFLYLSPGTYIVYCQKAKQTRRLNEGAGLTVNVGSGEDPIALELPTGRLSGKLLGPTAPAVDRLVLYWKEDSGKNWNEFHRTQISTGQDHFTFEALPPGRYCLVAFADGNVPWGWQGPLRVDGSAVVDLTPATSEGPAVQVLDARTGSPIAGAAVEPLLDGDFPLFLPGRTNAEGRVRIPGLPEGGPVEAKAERYVTWTGQPAGGIIHLEPMARVIVKFSGKLPEGTLRLRATVLSGNPGWRRPYSYGTRVPEGFELECAPQRLEIKFDLYAGSVKDPDASWERQLDVPAEGTTIEIALP